MLDRGLAAQALTSWILECQPWPSARLVGTSGLKDSKDFLKKILRLISMKISSVVLHIMVIVMVTGIDIIITGIVAITAIQISVLEFREIKIRVADCIILGNGL